MVQRILRVGRIHAAQEIQVEKIFPRFSPQRARFDLGQIQVAQRKSAQRAKQRPGTLRVLNTREVFQCALPVGPDGMPARIFGRSQEKKPGKILAVAFNRSAQNAPAINFRGHRGGDRAGIRKPFFR